jgi:K+-sensing histidine kinase KdpD
MNEPSSENRSPTLSISWEDAARFIRQLSHDLRNDLNANELQCAYIDELATSEELKNEIKSLRAMISGLSSTLQRLSRAVGEVKPNQIPYRAADFMEDLRRKIEHDFSKESAEITWDIQLGDAMLNVDPLLLQEAVRELFANAFQHDREKDPLLAKAKIDGRQLLFTLREPKTRFDLSTQDWGRKPLGQMRQRHYGLGLYRARAIVEAHCGTLHAQYDSGVSALITTVTLPVLERSAEKA